MKKPLFVLIGLLVLIAAGLAVFLSTFDADRYRPLLIAKLQEAAGRPVSLERVTLGWRGGLALELRGLAIADTPGTQAEPLLQVESASAVIRLLPLLGKRVEVTSIVLTRPRIHAARDAQGRLNLLGLAAVAAPAASGAPTAPSASPLNFHVASLRISEGSLHWTDAAARPPAELWLKRLDLSIRNIAPGRPLDVTARGALAGETPNITLEGRVILPGSGTAGAIEDLRLTLERLSLDALLPPTPSDEPRPQGVVTLHVDGAVPTLDPSQAVNRLTAAGRLRLDEPRVANLNLLREVFERISLLPGLAETLLARLPEGSKAKLAAPDTVFEPIEASVQVRDGWLHFDELQVRSDAFSLTGSGRVGLDRTIDLRAVLRIEPELSNALVGSVNELQGIVVSSGEMEIPLTIQGQAPRVAVLPDLQYLASKLLVTKVQDLLGTLLRKTLESPSPQ